MAEGNPSKSYYVQLPGYEKGEVWDEEKFNRNKEQLFKDHQDAMVMESAPLGQEEEVTDSSMFRVHLPGYQEAEVWDGAKLSRNREQLLKDHPDAEIVKATPINYWGDQLSENYSKVEALREELKGLPEPSVDMNMSDADALAAVQDTPERRRRAEINRDIDQLLRDRENNPAYKAYWEEEKKSLASDAQKSENEAKRHRKEEGANLETDYYNLASRFYKDALKTANAPSKYDESNGFANFAKGVGQNVMSAVSLLEFAKSLDSLNLVDTVKQIQKAKGDEADLSDLINNHPEELDFLTDGQREMLKAFVRKAEVESGRADNMSVGYNAGRGAIQSAGFMADFLLTGGAGDAAASAATRKLGLQASRDIVAKGLGQQAKKLAIGNLEGAVKALAMTPMMPSSYSNFINNLTTLNEGGQMDLGAKAVLNSVGDVLIENFSENAGELFGIPFEGKIFDSISKSQLGNIGRALSRTDAATLFRQAGFHGLVGEMAEEVLGNAMRSVTGIDKDALSNFLQKDEFLTTLASFAPMTVLGGLGKGYSTVKTYRKASKAGSELEKILSGLGMDEKKIREVMDLSEADSPQLIGSWASEIGREAIATGKVTQDNIQELGEALGKYVISQSELKVLKGVLAEEDDVRRAQDSAMISGQTGTDRWWHEGEDGNGYVRTITDQDGNESFVISEMDGELALVDRSGQKTFMSAESLANGIEAGALTDSGEKAINEYLDNIEDTRTQMAEAERMSQERAEQVSSIQSRLEADPSINIGTDEAPINATVTGMAQDGVVVEWDDESGHQTRQMTWDEAGQYLGTPVEVRTDDQIEQEEAEADEEIAARRSDYNNNIPEGTEITVPLVEGEAPVTYQFKRAFVGEDGNLMLQVTDKETGKDEQITEEMALQGDLTTVLDSFKNPTETEAEETETTVENEETDDTLRDFRGNPIPLKDDGTVNQTALWNADPEAWARWNDGQRQDGGANSRGYIAKAVKKLQSDAKAIQKQIDKELDFDKIGQLEGQLAGVNGRIADLSRIEANYAAAAASDAVQGAEANVEAAPVMESKREENPVAEAGAEEPVQVETPRVSPEEADARLAERFNSINERLGQVNTPEEYETLMQEKRQALEEYYEAIGTEPAIVCTRADILQRMKAAGCSKYLIDAVRNQLGRPELTEGFRDRGIVFIIADDIRNEKRAKLAHYHEHWHNITKAKGYAQQLVANVKAGVDYLLKAANKMAGVEATNGYAVYLGYRNPEEALADEVISLSMEVIADSTPEDVDENLRKAGLDNQEIINFVKTIYDGEQRNGQDVSPAGRGLSDAGDNAEASQREDGRDSSTQSEGNVGESGSGVEGRGIQGAGEGGLDTSRDREVAEEGFLPGERIQTQQPTTEEGVSSIADAARQDDGGVRLSIRTEKDVQRKIRKFAKSEEGRNLGWTDAKIDSIIEETADLIRAIHASVSGDKYYDEWAKKNPTVKVDWRDGVEKPTVTWSRANIEYKYDMSADLLYINNEGLENVLASPTMVDLMLKMNESTSEGFTSDDYLRLYETLRDMGFVVPCKGCFDAAMRLKMLPSVSRKFADLVNKTIDERNKDPEKFDAALRRKAGKDATINGLPTSAANKEDAIRIGVAGDNLTEHISFTQLMSAEGQTKALTDWGGIFRAWQRTGAGRPKDKLMPEPWTGDIVSTTTTIIGKYGEKTPSYRDILVNMGTGLRRNSHSEFRPLLAIDEIQFMREAFIRNLTVFKYMKELDDVRLFGQLGVKFNMSFFPAFVEGAPAAGLDANGDYIAAEESVGGREFEYTGEDGKTHYDGMRGFEEARKHVNKDVSLSSVIFSVPHLIKALTDVPTVRDKNGIWGSLIPFHASGATARSLESQGLGKARAIGVGHGFDEAFTDYDKGVTNFEAVQNERFGEGWEILEGKKAGTAVEPGHKLEFANGTHYYNKALGLHLFGSFYIYDSELRPEHYGKDGKIDTRKAREAGHPFELDYNDKVREIGTDTAYKDAADFKINMLKDLGLLPGFDFDVPEDVFLKMCADAKVDPNHPKLGWRGPGNSWNPIDSEAWYALECDYGMTDPATGKWAPHNPVGMIDENGERVFRLPDNAVEIIRNGVQRYGERKSREESRELEAIEEFARRTVAEGKLSQEDADAVLAEARRERDERERREQARRAVLDFIEGRVNPIDAANMRQKQPGASVSETVTEADVEEVAMFRLSRNNKATVESWIGKREDLTEEQRREVVDYIDKLDDAKTQLATARWFANGTIRIPEDMKKVQQAISVAGKAKVDPLKYKSPMELLDAHAEFKPSEERINPDEVSTLHRAAEYPEGIVVYDVDDTEESRKNMRKIINSHFGEDASPWCLLQGDGKGKLTADSKRYWRHYNAYPKQVAFKDGKLLAFSANDSATRVWWDKQDESHLGIPITKRIDGDELGRSAAHILADKAEAEMRELERELAHKYNCPPYRLRELADEGDIARLDAAREKMNESYRNGGDYGFVKEPGALLFKGNQRNGIYEEWSEDGTQILERTGFKNGKADGLREAWYDNGQMEVRGTYKDDIIVGRYEAWFYDGTPRVLVELDDEGRNNGVKRMWHRNGVLQLEETYDHGKHVGTRSNWDEDGNLVSVMRYSDSGELLASEDHDMFGIRERRTYVGEDGQVLEKFYRGNRLASVERTQNGRLEGLQEYFYADGIPQTRSEYSNGERNGIFERYHVNGTLQARGEYKDGMREGVHEVYNRNGDLISRSEYHNDAKVRELPLNESGVMFRKAFDSANEELEGERVSVDNPDLMREYGLSNVTMTKKGDLVTLNKVVVAEKKKGNGTRFMNDLTSEADNNGWTLALTPDDSFGATSVGRLKKFYKRFGFKENKGRNADLTVNESMIRQPEAPRFRLSEREQMDQDYMAAVEAGDMETAQRMVDDMAEAAGYTIRGYHGTTHDFTVFDRSKGNAEGNWGKGFYFTNNEDDAEANYAGEGPDLTNRIEHLAENMEWMDGYEDMSYEERFEEARKQLAGDNPHTISAAIKMENPVVFDSHYRSDETFFDYNSGYNEETDEYEEEPSGKLVDFVEAWNDVLYDFDYQNVSPDSILEYADYDGLTASQLENKAREILDSVGGIMTVDGEYASGEFLRQVFERMGFDGIVDNNVNIKFGTQRKYGRSMDGMDYGTTHVIAFKPNQIKQTDPVTYDDEGKVIPLSKRFDSWNEDIRFRKANQTQNGFISNAEAALDRIKMDKATPEQWIKMLEKEGGLKAGEDKWLGLSDWLKESDRKTLTKDEVGDFIEQNRIQIEEVHYSENVSEEQMKESEEALNRYREEYADFVSEFRNGEVDNAHAWSSAWDYAFVQMIDRYGDDFNRAFERDGNTITPVIDYRSDEFNDAAKRLLGIDGEATAAINFDRLHYTTQDLENKREIALTVPTIDPYYGSLPEIHFADQHTKGKAVAWIRFGDATSVETDEREEEQPKEKELTPEQRERLDSLEEQVRRVGLSAQDARNQEEWDAAEAAIREAQTQRDAYKEELGLNERPVSQRPSRPKRRSKVLVIDEIQSQRHQDAREKGGYAPKDGEISAKLDEIAGRQIDIDNVITKITDSRSLKEAMEHNAEYKRLEEQQDKAREEYKELRERRDNPKAAPFEKNWHELAMKRMLRLAAEEGYDKIAWTTGDQQAERYNLGGVLESIDVTKYANGGWRLYFDFVNGDNDDAFFNKDGVCDGGGQFQGKHMSEVVGKEMASRIMDRQPIGKFSDPSIADSYEIQGEGLRIGGEGMKGFYDDILPRFMNKYGKKWGVKVGTVELQHVYDELGHPLVMHSVDVTPEMRESVMEGQVMFRKAQLKKEVLDTFKKASSGELKGKPISIGRLTDPGREFLETISGTKMKETVDFVLNPSDLRHIYNNHYGDNEKDKGNNIPLTDTDIENIVDVIEQPEAVIYLGKKESEGNKFAFLSSSEEGAYNLIEVYGDRRGNLTAKTFYNTKRGVSQRAMALEEPVHSTSETEGATSFDSANIPILFDLSNIKEQISVSEEDNSDIRYSLRGIIGAENAEDEAALDNLEVAEDMEAAGKDMPLFRKSQDLVRQSRESGMAGVVGDEDASELYRDIYRAVPSDIRQMIVDKAGDGYIFTDATRDMISEAVEKGDETGIAGLAANMLRNYVGDLDERTARYILWRGTRRAADDDLIDTVNDIAMQRRLQVGEFADPVMFRLSDDVEEAQTRADSMADDAKAELDEKKADAKDNDALTTIKAMSLQKEYDRKTVNTITVLAKNIIKDQSIDTLNRREIARLLGIITTSVGKAPKTVKKNVDALIGMVVDHLVRSEETKLGMLTSKKASKTNQAGVEVQGELDVRGQNVLKAYKAGLNMEIENPNDEDDPNTIKARLSVLSDRLLSEDDAIRSEAEDEYAGLMLAQEYLEKIRANVNEAQGIRNEMREAAEALRDGDLTRSQYNEFVTEAENSLRENKIERVEAYRALRAKMAEMMAGSVEARKEFNEREKRRVEEIHHLANSDMQGRDASPFRESTRTGRLANSSIVRFFAKPLATFDQMLRLFGGKNVAGEGYLWNKFHRGWLEANERAYLGERDAKSELDAKVSEVFDEEMRWSDLYKVERKMPTVKVKWWDGGEMREHELTQGNLLYIYMVNKMTDGRMKLRRMGITQETVDAIARQMDPRFIELADWLQGEYLVNKRNKYNEVHERLFGASMAAIEDYFPLKINKRSLNKAEDIGRPEFDDALPATTTGSIIKRKRNAQDLDLANADAFSVVIEHIEQMEQWAAFAELNKDLNTLLSYKRFRNQVQNMASVYGSGRELWNNFKSVCRIAGGTYNPAGKKSDLDTAALNIAKGVTAAKISFRVYTALKQFLSMPAFVADASPKYIAANMATPWKAWNWAMENLPMFEKRWKSRQAGDTRLMKTESDWKLWRNQIVEKASQMGMSPNAFVDALTVSIGSHSIYQSRYDRYIKDGYTEEQADKKAKQDATTLYNETQQSNEAAFVAPVQLDRTVLSTMLTVFRNSSMGYQRQLHDAIRNIGKMLRPGYKSESVEFMKLQMIRDGLTEEQAEHAAERSYNREIWRSAARVATFGFLVQFAWNLGGSIAYLLFGDDDDKKEEMLTEAALHGLIGGSMEGLAGGNVMSEAINMVAKGESLSNYDPSLLPIVSDLKSAYKKMSYDPVAGWNDLINLAIQAGIGVNPQTLTDAVVAVVDACGGDLDTSKEAMLLIMRVLQVPQSQVDQIYIDELGTNAAGARKMSPGEMAERYARYKVAKGAPLTGWAYSDEAEEKREKAYLKRFKKLVKERKESER